MKIIHVRTGSTNRIRYLRYTYNIIANSDHVTIIIIGMSERYGLVSLCDLAGSKQTPSANVDFRFIRGSVYGIKSYVFRSFRRAF